MRAWLVVLLGVVVTSCTCGPAKKPVPAADPLAGELSAFRARATSVDAVRFDRGFPSSVIATVPVHGATNLERARDYLAQAAGLYGQGEPLTLEVRRYTRPDRDGLVVFHQSLDGVPVWGAELAVLLSGDEVHGTFGRLLTARQRVDVHPQLTAGQAVQRARTLANLPGAPLLAPATLVVFDPAFLGRAHASAPVLGWRLALGTQLLLIDAHTGELAHARDLRQAVADPDMSFWVDGWVALGPGHWGTTQAADEAGPLPGVDDPVANDLALMLRTTWDWYYVTLGWSGPDGVSDVSPLETVGAYVHEDLLASPGEGANAWSDGQSLHFWDSFVGLDVVGHEYTHQVIDHGSRLVYAGEPGALNEAYADLFGNLVQGTNWEVSESAPIGAIRDMQTPSRFGDPDRFSQFVVTSRDNGGVHTNSGIINRLHYLLAAGGTQLGTSVPPIGKEKVTWLALSALLELPENADFAMAQHYDLLKTREWMKSGDHGFTSQDLCSVRLALHAVELLGTDSLDADCDLVLDSDDKDDDADGVPDTADNCPGVVNPSQADRDGDGQGDACDEDSDNDGAIDGYDNCELPNADQADTDEDGIGDACQDPDQDGVLDSADNCPTEPNRTQVDTDGNGAGDACDPDRDGDGLFGVMDNCPFVSNADQVDDDGDGLGNACDPCSTVSTPGAAWSAGLPSLGIDPAPLLPDEDGDGVPDACDDTPTRGGRVQVGGRPFAPSDLLPGASGATLDVSFGAERVVALPLPRCLGACPAPGFDDAVRLGLRGVPAEVQVAVLDDEGRGVTVGHRAGDAVTVRFVPRGGRDYQLQLLARGSATTTSVVVSSERGPQLAPLPRQPCAGAAHGKPCLLPTGTPGLCLGGACALSRCGDGWLAAGEACDDGNELAHDGCEPTSCTFSCTAAADCDDGAPCNGVESCVAHRCVAGTPPSASLSCTLLGGGAGTCRSGACASASCGNGTLDVSEACDDGNVINGDGCDNGCVFSCTSAASCDDGDTCNGAESCTLATHTCALGQPRSCSDADACTADRCDALLGCVSRLIDVDGDGAAPASLGACGRDCDDTRADVSPTAAEVCDGVDNDCDGQVDEGVRVSCVPDLDGDGFGAGTAVQRCACGAGFVPAPPTRALDCLDGNASVFPGQLASFSLPYCAAPSCTAPTSFDYDCDGQTTPRWPTLAGTCTLARGVCTGSGWTRGVPACGAAGVFQSCALTVLGGCSATNATRTQECR